MASDIKVERPSEAGLENVGTPELDGFGAEPSCYRKRPISQEVDPLSRLPDMTSSSIEAMHFMLRQWGLEALEERFDEHLIDINVLDYILDVDIIELCRDLPIRYRLVLRRNLQNKHHKRILAAVSPSRPKSKRFKQTNITFTKDATETTPLITSESENTNAENCFEDTEPTHFVSVETTYPDDHDSDGTESGMQEDEFVFALSHRFVEYHPRPMVTTAEQTST